VADIPPIMVQLGGSATGFLRMITNAIGRLDALTEAATAAAEACSTAFDAVDASASAMGDAVRASAASAGEAMTAMGDEAKAAGVGVSSMGEEIAASMQAASADIAAAAAEMRAAVTEMADTVKTESVEAGEATEGLGAKFLGLGEIGTMVKGLLPLSLAAVGYESIKMASTFQASMTQINTQAGVSKDKIAQLSNGVLDLAGQVGFSPDSLSEALFHVESSFASTGITGQKAMDILKTAAEGAAVGHANLVDVQNALDAAIASGIPGVQNYSQAMGALNAIVGSGDMQMQDLANALGTGVLAVVKGYGLSLNDVGAALATFGDNNIRGAVAATDLRMAVQAMAVPAATAKDDLARFGMTSQTLADDMRTKGLNGALNDLMDRMRKAGVTASQQGQVITDMFGKKAGSGLAVLLGQLDRFNSKYPDLEKGAGGFASAWQTAQHTLSQEFADIKAGFDSVMIRIGTFLIPQVSNFISLLENKGSPVVHGFASALSGIASGFTGSATKAAPVATGRNARLQEGAGAAAAPPALTGWQKLGQTVRGIADDFRKFGDDAATAFGNLEKAAKPVLQVFGTAFVGALVVIGGLLANVVGPALKGFTDFLAHNQGLVKFFAEVILAGLAAKLTVIGGIKAATSITELASKLLGFPFSAVSNISKTFDGLKKAASDLATNAGKIKDAFMKIPWSSIGSGIGKAFTTAWGAVQDGLVKIAGKAGQAWRGVQDLLVNGASKAGEVWRGLQAGAGKLFSGIADAASTAWSGITSTAQTAASGVATAWSSVGDMFTKIGGFATDLGGKIANAASAGASTAWSSLTTGLSGVANGLKQAALMAWEYVAKATLATGAALKQAGSMFIEKTAAFGAAIAEKAAAAAEWLLNLAMDASPLMLVVLAVIAIIAILVLCYEKVGWFRDFVNAAFKGISVIALWLWHNVFEPAFQGIAKAATWLWDNAIKPAAESIGSAFSTLAHAAQTAFSWIVSAGEHAASWLSALPGRILGWFADAGKWLWNAGVSIIQGLWNGIQSMGSWIASSITGFIKSVVPGPVLKVLGIFSPSRVFHDIGVNVTKGLVNGITAGKQQVTSASTNLALSAVTGFGSPGVALGVSGGRQLAMAGAGYAGAAAGAGGQVVTINVAGTVVAERQLRDLLEKLNLQRGGRNSQTYQSAKK
jgi:TP901 family phage tail tape measure protein